MATLRITLRALHDDLGLDESVLDEAPERLAKRHKVLKAFVKQRSQQPTANETTNLPSSPQVVFNLHAGRYRGLTWYDESDDVVWLLGAGWHEKGSINDAYIHLRRLDADGQLLPTEFDYQLLYEARERQGVSGFSDVIAAALELGPTMLATAQEQLGVRLETSLAGVFDISLVVKETIDDDMRIWRYEVRFHLPPAQPGVLPSDNTWVTKLAPAFLPSHADVSLLGWLFDDGALLVAFDDLRGTDP